MKLHSIYASQKKTLQWKDQTIETGILKTPLTGKVQVDSSGILSDVQVDRKHHGGEFKALYSYALEDYEYWRQSRGADLPFGAFGENLLTEGLNEQSVFIGNRYRIGNVEGVVTQPRFPCRVLSARFQDHGIMKEFLQRGRFGIYFKVLKEGEIEAGDAIELLQSHPAEVGFHELAQLYLGKHPDPGRIQKIQGEEFWDPYWDSKLLKVSKGPKREGN